MEKSPKIICIVIAVFILGACATAPTWKGMSESEIAAWQGLGVDAKEAQTFVKAGLRPDDVANWNAAGINSYDSILEWHSKEFSSNEAASWIEQQFDVDEAVRWKKENFQPEEAQRWKSQNFDLKEAIKNREKGLQPIRE